MGAAATNKVYGLMAEFETPASLLHAAHAVRDAGYRNWEVFTPFPIHGIDKVMGYKNSLVGWVSLAFGTGAFVSVVGLILYANGFDNRYVVGGKPYFSEPMTFVPAYILLIMGAAIGSLVGMLGLNQLPRLHHPLLAKKRFDLVTRDKFVVVIGANDAKFDCEQTKQMLASLGGSHIETVEEPE